MTLVNTMENLPAGFAVVPAFYNIGQRRNHSRLYIVASCGTHRDRIVASTYKVTSVIFYVIFA